jgi:hypothetical protein
MISNDFIKDLVVDGDIESLKKIKRGINDTVDESINIIEEEDPRTMKNKRNRKIDKLLTFEVLPDNG